MTSPSDLPQDNPQEPHKPADDREEIYFQGSPALRWQLKEGWYWVLFGFALIASPIALKARFTPQMPWWIIPIGLVLGIILVFVPWVEAWTYRYKVSNYRIDREKGILRKDFDTLELWHVEDIQMSQSLPDRILRVGTLRIYSHDDTVKNESRKSESKGGNTDPHLEMSGLPNPRPLYELLKQRIIAVKRQRGVIKMDTGTMDTGDVSHDAHH